LKGELEVRIRIGGAAAVLAIAAVGCGSGGDSPEAALTKAQFIKRGDAICHAAQKEKTEAVNAWSQEDVNRPKTLADWNVKGLLHFYVTVVLPPIKKASEELSALSPPSGDAKAEKPIKALTAAVRAVEAKPIRAIKEAPYARADRLAKAYGLGACSLF
jgi:hypothetical protein